MARNRSRHAKADPSRDWEADPDRIGQILSRVQLPLSNAEFALEQYLLSHGQRLDTETRMLLAGVRDCIGRAAASARDISLDTVDSARPMDQRAA